MQATVARLSRQSTIGWVGLGAMGHPMALNLFSKMHAAHLAREESTKEEPRFLICEQDDRRATSFLSDLREKGGAELAGRVDRVGNGKEIAREAARIFTMLPSTPQVEAVYLDEHTGLLAGLIEVPAQTAPLLNSGPLPGAADVGSSLHTVLIDQTTLDPTAARSVASKVLDRTEGRAVMLDAPVSGGIVGAAAASLTIMLGSPSPAATALAIPLLQMMARPGGVIQCGGSGNGLAVKVSNKYALRPSEERWSLMGSLVLGINQVGLAEGLALGRSLGVDPLLLHEVFNSATAQSWSSKVNSPLPEVTGSPGSRGYSGGFQSRLMLKVCQQKRIAKTAVDPSGRWTCSPRSLYVKKKVVTWPPETSVYEWLGKKQAQGVERGWKDDPADS